MARYLTSKTLIESAVNRAMLPINQNTFLESDFLRFANEEMDMAIIPHVLSYHEDHFLTTIDIELQENQARYEIPYRAVGNKLRDVIYLDNNKNQYAMTRLSIGDTTYYQYDTGVSSNALLKACYIEGNEVVLVPSNNIAADSGWIRMAFYMRPSALVSEKRAMTINSIDRTNGTIVVDQVPTIFQTGQLIDFNKRQGPHTNLAFDIPMLNVDSVAKMIQVDPELIPERMKAGDIINMPEECIIPQIPTDVHSMLAQRIACRCLEALGDQAGLQAANAKLAEMEQKSGTILDARIEDAPLKVLNRYGLLRRTRRYIRR